MKGFRVLERRNEIDNIDKMIWKKNALIGKSSVLWLEIFGNNLSGRRQITTPIIKAIHDIT
jgi:hypothetical protein